MTEFDATVPWSPEDGPLRQDVRFLGDLLGEVLRQQSGREVFSHVEAARKAARRWRSGDEQGSRELDGLLLSLEAPLASEVTLAFSSWFGLVNMAEQVHRIRRSRDRQATSGAQRGSLEAVVASIAQSGVELETLLGILGRTQVEPVFTAHPTRALRRTILAKEQNIARALLERMTTASPTDAEQEAIASRIRVEVATAWQTDEHLTTRPTVADEAEYVLFYLSDVVYRIIPTFYEALERAIHAAYGTDAAMALPFPIVRFGSWVGGDMDGNPNVGADTIQDALSRHRTLILDRYIREVRHLFDALSQSETRVDVSADVRERVSSYAALLPQVDRQIQARYREMPYRHLLWLMSERLAATKADAPGGYEGAEQFVRDLELIGESLCANRGEQAGWPLVRRLLWRALTFGFHLATLDIRQDSQVHRRVAGVLLGEPGFVEMDSQRRLELLRRAMRERISVPSSPDDETSKAIAVMRAIAEGRRRYGDMAVGPYIISMAQGADDALAVLLIARAAGLVDDRGQVPLDVTPLFETITDLSDSEVVMESLLRDDSYVTHLEARGGAQWVMLGYSDSSKDGGIAASRWALYDAQSRLVALAQRENVDLTFFHGRGGTAGRGGSKPREGVLAEPPGAVSGRFRVTEQGEIIHAKYGLRGIGIRTLELMAGAVVEATLRTELACWAREPWVEVMREIAVDSRAFYRALVDHPDLVPYFQQATPIDVIERMLIGSRPTARREARGLEDMRAIPWVFAWTQNRHMIPGWFGVGTGLQSAVRTHGLSSLRDMHASWPFFTNLIADVEMVLAKADMRISRRYAALAGDLGDRVFPIIEGEYARTRELVLAIQDTNELLARDRVLRRNILLRNPYIDPMSIVQIDLLRRWRDGQRADRELERALFTTVKGIARGLQNTG